SLHDALPIYSISGWADVVWAGRQRGGLTRLQFRNGAIASQSYTKANGLAQNSAYAVYESRDGSAWAGTLNGGVSKFKDGHFTTYTTTDGLASNTVSSILETHDGRSEERRVGKECRCRWWRDQYKEREKNKRRCKTQA